MVAIVDLEQVKIWAREAGEIALRHFNQVSATFKADHTLVTRADREIEALLVSRIRAAFPEHGLIAEEGARAAGTEVVWAVDPLDGTRAFVHGLPCWGIAIGAMVHGAPAWGLFYMPVLDDWTYTTDDGGACCNGRDLSGALRGEWDDQSYLALSASAHWEYDIGVKRTRALGSVQAGMVYLARGSALGGFFHNAAIWDLAAGAAILARLGGKLEYLSGKPVDWAALLDGRYVQEPVLAAHPALLGRLRESIRKR